MLLVFGILASVIVLQLACNYVLVEPYYTWKRSHLIERAYEELQKETGNREKMVEIRILVFEKIFHGFQGNQKL